MRFEVLRLRFGRAIPMRSLAAVTWAVCIVACSSSDKKNTNVDTVTGAGGTPSGGAGGVDGSMMGTTGGATAITGGTGGTITATGGTSAVGGSGGTVFSGGASGSSGGVTSVNPDAFCFSTAYAAEPMPADMYIMLDQSTSMNMTPTGGTETKWTSVTNAIKSFVQAQSATGLGVGLQYFGLPDPTNASSNYQQCDPAVYATPEIPIQTLPDVAASIVSSIDMHSPSQLTPTGPALQGAIDYMKAWAPNHAGRASVVVLVTDGFPTECDPQQITDIAAIAQNGATTVPKVRTYVVGIGAGFANLNNIAQAGGTGSAFLIESGDVEQQFLTTMLNIASTPLQCEFDIPTPPDPSQMFDKDLVQVLYTTWTTGVQQQIPKIGSIGDCEANLGVGWYYDSESAPTKILICPAACDEFAAGRVDIALGCAPVIGIIR